MTMNSSIQKLNDKYLQLGQLLTDFDKVLGDTVTIYTVEEGELGREYGEIDTYDEYGIEALRKIYDRLEEIVNG